MTVRTQRRSFPLRPVARPTVRVRHGNDQDSSRRLFLEDESIRKTSQSHPAVMLLLDGVPPRILTDLRNGDIDRVQETPRDCPAVFGVPVSRLSQFAIRQTVIADFGHNARNSVRTFSQGTAPSQSPDRRSSSATNSASSFGNSLGSESRSSDTSANRSSSGSAKATFRISFTAVVIGSSIRFADTDSTRPIVSGSAGKI